MRVITTILNSSLLIHQGEAQPDGVVSTVEQYCFPRSGGPFTGDSFLPSVTMIFSGTTWTTTAMAVTLSSVRQTPSSNLVIGGTGIPIATSGTTLAINSTPTALAATSRGGISNNDPSKANSITLTVSSTPPIVTSISTSFISGFTLPASVTIGSSNTRFPINFAPTAVSNSTVNTAHSTTHMFIDGQTRSLASGTTVDDRLSFATGGPPVPSNLPSPASPPSSQASSSSNETLSLSAAAVDALQLALFLKNLEVSLFSSIINSSDTAMAFAPGLTGLTANISQQERTQHRALQAMLRRTGGADIPPCQYTFPDNTTELVLLMHALKVIEVGVHLSVADSLSSTDAMIDTLLSSIASVAAGQDALLRAAINSRTSLASFNTPLSDIWAYNLALGFTRPGSCARELPIPILPVLSLNNKTTAFARAGEKITLGWDIAARAALSRSGKPLFIGWVNQVDAPVYTPLTPVGDAMGYTNVPAGMFGTAFAVLTAQIGIVDINELTDATLAGPVMVSLLV